MIAIICIVVVLVVLVGMYFSYNNKEVALRKEAEAQKGKIEGVHDKMWKVIQQKAEVSNEYREAFEKIYPELISGRYANDNGSVMKWIQESNPEFDTSLYKDLQQAIEIQREYFNNAQTRMLDVIKERETLIETYPAKWFISNKQKIDYEVISSTATKTTMTTGIDDEVSVFKKK
ncbi:MAG: hypothetical protein Q4D30_07005 [Bacteroidales bacterium]|nr:hypothetical protein [Bacteroidaceae bacterium]MDO4186217.1 hypothetical protein [Bacteroidales bacterium]MBR1940028.1 hypothetical protein [Bacteroidaceae bacterium]MBR2160905.1 hypothetical protein [Bacteroidaceae bacterium]MBR3013830.1 hypothetical protein [Bacteroidaceae bacterium]